MKISCYSFSRVQRLNYWFQCQHFLWEKKKKKKVSSIHLISFKDSWWVEHPQVLWSPLSKAEIILWKSREVQAGHSWEGNGANLSGSHFQAHMGQDSNWEEPVWLCQMTSGQTCCLVWWDDWLNGCGENRECFLLCLYQGFLQGRLFIFREKGEIWIG